jgi:hypothetical protein
MVMWDLKIVLNIGGAITPIIHIVGPSLNINQQKLVM